MSKIAKLARNNGIRKTFVLAWALSLVSTMSLFPTLVKSAPQVSAQAELGEHVRGELLVKFSPDKVRIQGGTIADQSLAKVSKANDVSSIEQVNTDVQSSLYHTYKMILPEEKLQSAISEFKKNPLVEYAEPNYIYYIAEWNPNDTLYASNQYYLNDTTNDNDINGPQAWDMWRGTTDTVVAVIDSGIDTDHPDLEAKRVAGYDYVDNDSDPDSNPNGIDDDGNGTTDSGVNHGSHVSGTIAAVTNNSVGIAGVCPNCKIMPIRVLNDEGSGTTTAIINGIDFAVNNGAEVINMSLGGSYSTAYDDALGRAYADNIPLIIAAGNETSYINAAPRSPVANDGSENRVLGVGALAVDGTKAGFSNYGDKYVDVSAPGVDIHSTIYYSPALGRNDYYGNSSGTSMATPITAGVAALIRSHFPELSVQQVYNRITSNVRAFVPGVDAHMGAGRVDAAASVTGALSFITAPGAGMAPTVKGFNNIGTEQSETNFNAYESTFTGGVNVATGNIDSDAADEIITGPGPHGGPFLRVWEKDGTQRGIQFFPFHPNFHGGLSVASGDVDGDGKNEIAVAQQSEGQAWIKVYRYNSQKEILAEFNAFGTPEVGASIAMGDLDNDGKDELIVGAGPGGGPQIRAYNIGTTTVTGPNQGATLMGIQFFAFHPNNRSGIHVAAGDYDGDSKDEIAVSQGAGDEAWTKVYRYNSTKTVLGNWRAYPAGVTSGAVVAMGDIDGDGQAEVITAPDANGGPQVRAFNVDGTELSSINFFAYSSSFRGGARVAVGSF